MEGQTEKRGRREEGEEKMAIKTAKTLKQEMFYQQPQEESDESQVSSDGKYVGSGVFDFPWLHDNQGMISKSDEEEYWNFQDTFSCLLHTHTCPPCLYETPTTPPTKLEEINVWPLELEAEMESADCIWSWMLNHQPHH